MKFLSFTPAVVKFLEKASQKVSILFLLFVLTLFIQNLHAQTWLEKISKGNTNFYEIKKAFYDNHKNVKGENGEEEEDGDFAKFKRWEWFMESRVFPSGDITLPSRNWENFKYYLQSNSLANQRTVSGSTSSLLGNWTSLGPFTTPIDAGLGRLNFIRFDPINPNIIWVGSPSGGLWKSNNSGTTWNAVTDFLSLIGCSDLIINPSNPNIMYLATGDGVAGVTQSIGVLKSFDGGVNWSATGLVFPISYYQKIHKLLIDPSNHNILLAATSDGIYKTIDAGNTWVITQAGIFSDIEFKPSNSSIVYAVTKNGGLFYKSTNTGSSFSNIISGLPASTEVRRYAIGVSANNSNYVYILACNTTGHYLGLYKSTNSGINFSLQSNSPDIVTFQGWYNLSIAVNPNNANDVYVGGVLQWRSIDGGVNWSQLPYTHSDVHALEFLPGSSTTLFSGNDGGIYRSIDNGSSWVDLSNGLVISQIYRIGTSATNSNLNLLGLQDNGNIRQLNNNCQALLFADGMENIIDYTNPEIMYVSAQNGSIYKSITGGSNTFNIVNNNGTEVHAPSSWVTPYIMHPSDPNTLLVGKQQVYRSVNGGINWSQVGLISNGLDIYLRSLAYAPSNPNYIYAASHFDFYCTTNGNTFTKRIGPSILGSASITSIAVSNSNPNKVWITISAYVEGEKVFLSTDAGVTWANYSAGLPNLPANCIVYESGSNDRVYVGMDIGVYYRDNTMPSWQPFFEGLPNVIVNELEIHYGSAKIRAATYGRGLWESNLLPGCATNLFTWTGSVSTAWENTANWSCGMIPGPDDDVLINSGTVILSSNTSIRSIKVNPGVNFTVTPAYKLTINH